MKLKENRPSISKIKIVGIIVIFIVMGLVNILVSNNQQYDSLEQVVNEVQKREIVERIDVLEEENLVTVNIYCNKHPNLILPDNLSKPFRDFFRQKGRELYSDTTKAIVDIYSSDEIVLNSYTRSDLSDWYIDIKNENK